MHNKKSGKPNKGKKQTIKPITYILGVMLLAGAIIGVALASGTNGNAVPGPAVLPTVPAAQTGSLAQSERAPALITGDLVLNAADITEQAAFYPILVDGVEMEVLAVKAPDGTIRTAFNTCQVCYDSGRGYFVQEGSVLICQNCGNSFLTSDVELARGGCNPLPIMEDFKTVTDSTITISHEILEAAKVYFLNWKY